MPLLGVRSPCAEGMINRDTFQDCANNEVIFGCHFWTKMILLVKEIFINKLDTVKFSGYDLSL